LFNRKVSPFEDSVDFVSEAPPFALLCLEGDTFRFTYMGLRLREAPPFHFVCNFYYVRNAAIIKVRIRPFEDALYCLRSATPPFAFLEGDIHNKNYSYRMRCSFYIWRSHLLVAKRHPPPFAFLDGWGTPHSLSRLQVPSELCSEGLLIGGPSALLLA